MKVKCINSDSWSLIEEGKVYDARKGDGVYWIETEKGPFGYPANLFVQVKLQVKSIVNSLYLYKGTLYDVLDETETEYCLQADSKLTIWYSKSNFTPVEEPTMETHEITHDEWEEILNKRHEAEKAKAYNQAFNDGVMAAANVVRVREYSTLTRLIEGLKKVV